MSSGMFPSKVFTFMSMITAMWSDCITLENGRICMFWITLVKSGEFRYIYAPETSFMGW